MRHPVSPVRDPFADTGYDAVLYTIGFERRSSFPVRSGLPTARLIGFPFESNRIGQFSENLAISLHAGAEVIDGEDGSYRGALRRVVEGLPQTDRTPRIAVDISSMTRERLASTVLVLDELASRPGRMVLEVDFLYAVAEFAQPPDVASQNLTAGPVTPEYRGFLRRSSLPLAAVIGLGYEPQRALGVFELLEPTTAWAFRPIGTDARYGDAISRSNTQLLSLVAADHVVEYEVADPAGLVYGLDSFLFSISDEFRVVLLPLGPKIFALACLLLGLGEQPERPAVWRVGEGNYGSCPPVEEAGTYVGVRVHFGWGVSH